MTAKPRKRFDLRESASMVIVAIALFCAANLAFAAMFIRPLSAQLRVLEADAGTKLERVTARKKTVEQLEAYVKQLDTTKKNLIRLRDEVLSTRARKMIESQQVITDTAERFGTTWNQIRVENTDLAEEGLERMGVIVPLEGGYANLRKFVRAIESADRFLVIERVGLEQGRDGGALLQLQITLATYFMATKPFGADTAPPPRPAPNPEPPPEPAAEPTPENVG